MHAVEFDLKSLAQYQTRDLLLAISTDACSSQDGVKIHPMLLCEKEGTSSWVDVCRCETLFPHWSQACTKRDSELEWVMTDTYAKNIKPLVSLSNNQAALLVKFLTEGFPHKEVFDCVHFFAWMNAYQMKSTEKLPWDCFINKTQHVLRVSEDRHQIKQGQWLFLFDDKTSKDEVPTYFCSATRYHMVWCIGDDLYLSKRGRHPLFVSSMDNVLKIYPLRFFVVASLSQTFREKNKG